MIMDIGQAISDNIHKLGTSSKLYSGMFFGEYETIKTVKFLFNLDTPYDEDDDDFIADCRFVIDNIISKTIELNFGEDYKTNRRLGNFIYFRGEKYYCPFIINSYQIDGAENWTNIGDIEYHVDVDGDRYKLSFTYDVPKLKNVYEID